ncbi:TolC family protein [bacterium]|nr:TolC family protein [bacterium]
MNNISKAGPLIILLMMICAFSAGGEQWTLARTVKAALDASNAAAVERLNADGASIDAESAQKAWYPTASFTTGANVVSEVMEIKMPGRTIQFGGYDSYDMKFSVNQLIYDGGRLKAVEEAGKKLSVMNTHRAEAAELATEFQAKTAFFQLIMAEETLEASQESIREAENHLRDVNARRSQGMALENDVLRARLRISTVQMDSVTAATAVDRAKANFRKMTGVASDEDITIAWNETTKDFSALLSRLNITQYRPEFKAFDAAIEASEKTALSARAGIRPSIAMSGAFNYGKPGLDLPANKWMHYFTGGVRLNWNVWDWGKTQRDIKKVELNTKIIERNRDDFERTLKEQAADASARYKEAKRRSELAAEAAEFSKKNLELISNAYREGMASETDYDNAHTAFTKAILDQSVSRVNLHLTAAYIEYIIGIRYTGGNNE